MMGILANILGGGQAGQVADAVGKAGEIVERYAPGLEGKDKMVKELVQLASAGQDSARTADSPMASGVRWADALVNGINRLIRPGVTLGLVGGYMGWWHVPPAGSVDPELAAMLKIVLGFWFGARMIFQDLPQALAYLQGLKKV